MSDPAAHEGLARWLAYLHPVWMVASLGLTTLALRRGLQLRRGRRGHARRSRQDLRRHLTIAKPAVAMLGIGFLAGPLSMVWLRGREPFDSAHGWLGVLTITLVVATTVLGWRLEHGRTRAVDAHAALAALAVLAAAASAATGFVLLP